MTRLALFITLGTLTAFGQYSAGSFTRSGVFHGEVHVGAQSRFTPIKGAPYSGEVVTETVQTLNDGTHIRHIMMPTKVFRDSLGRERKERSPYQGPADMVPNSAERPTLIEITDPVGQVKYTLDVRRKVAHRQMLLPPVGGTTASLATAVNPVKQAEAPAPTIDSRAPQTVYEKVENQIIEGVLARGTHYTTTWPEGSLGNDRPIATVHENWVSVELKVVVLYKSMDPRFGESTEKLTNISRSEPDQNLFQPPPEYAIVDEKGSFTIKWGPEQQ
jgi:hypothetical protein